jgi:hypothetical protein
MRTTEWRVEVQLVPGGRLLLRSHMQVRGLSNMGLARLCGDEKYRSSISHLASGVRDGCSEELARKLTRVLLGDAAKRTPLFMPRVYRVTRDSATVGASQRRAA